MKWLTAACLTIAAFATTLALSAQNPPAPAAEGVANVCLWRCPASGQLFPKLPQCSANCIMACEPPPCQ